MAIDRDWDRGNQIDSESVMMDRNRRARFGLGKRYFRIAILGGSVAAGSFAGGLSAQTASSPAPVPGASPSSTAKAPALSLAEIQRLIDRGHADEAVAQLDKMAAAVPVPAGVQRLRGLAFYSQSKLQPAEQAFAAALVDDPADSMASRMEGITLYRLGRPAAAIPLLEAAAKATDQPAGQRPNGPVDPEYVLALCYADTRRYDDARHAFAIQYGFLPDSAAAYLLAARLMLRREFLPVAQQFARKALEISPQLPLAHRLLGETELADNHLGEAAAEFQKELQVNPLEPVTYDRLGDVYVRQGEFEKARASLQESVLLDPSATGPFILLGKVLLKQQDAMGASGYLEHAREMDPQNYMTHSLLGQAYRQMGRQEDARAETATAEKLQSTTAPKLEDVK